METLPWIAPGRLQDPITAGLQNFNLANPTYMFSENPVVKPLPGYLTSSWYNRYNNVIHKSGRERLILGGLWQSSRNPHIGCKVHLVRQNVTSEVSWNLGKLIFMGCTWWPNECTKRTKSIRLNWHTRAHTMAHLSMLRGSSNTSPWSDFFALASNGG